MSVILAVIGVVCLVWPSKIQEYALHSSSAARFNPFYNWMKKPAYIVSLRFCGIIALVMAILLLWGLILNRGT